MSRQPAGRAGEMVTDLGALARRDLLAAARAALDRHLQGGSIPPGAAAPPRNPTLPAHNGVVVTLRSVDGLRGCVGTLDGSIPLRQAVEGCAVSAASDPRFPPLEPGELARARIEISVLGPRLRIRDGSEIVLGRDGVMVRHGSRSGLLLPQVAVQQSWEAGRLLEEVCVKAGLPAGAWRSPETVVEAFPAEVFGEPEA